MLVTDVPPGAARTDVVYACGPMAMLRAVGAVAAVDGLPCQVAVEESMACGIGVCMTCVLPVVGDDGVTRMVRSCVDGPVFPADRVRWDDVGTVPPTPRRARRGRGVPRRTGMTALAPELVDLSHRARRGARCPTRC